MKKEGDVDISLAFRISTIAILTAITALFTYAVRIPVAPTRGYLNLGDVAIFFSAFTFGPVTALIAGGVGTAIADIVAGYSQWAPISLVVHGLQGLVIGLVAGIAAAGDETSPSTEVIRWIVAAIGGAAVMCGGYLLSGSLMMGFGAALVELPGNALQNAAGVLGGVPLSLAVRKAYPPVRSFRW